MRRFKRYKVNINRLLYTFIAIGILAIVGIGVYAFGGSQPSNIGHSAGELDLSGGVNGNAIFNGKVGIGTSNPSTNLDVAGSIKANSLTSSGSISAPEIATTSGLTLGGIRKTSWPTTTGSGISNPSKSCPSGQVIRSFNVSSSDLVCVSLPSSALCTWGSKTYSTGASCEAVSSCNGDAYLCQSDGTWAKYGATGSSCVGPVCGQ